MRATSIVKPRRFANQGQPAVFGVNRAWWQPEDGLEEFSFVGMQNLSRAERSFAKAIVNFAVGTRFATIEAADYDAEGEWRWSNDRDAFVREEELRAARNDQERFDRLERYRTRLSLLTWDQLLSETVFERWSPSPPFPPAEFTERARQRIRDACIALQALGPKPRRAEVRAVLKSIVQWFNQADENAGGVIETDEREDICAVLEEMAYIARQKGLVDEIDEWREW